jgi:plastocyanin
VFSAYPNLALMLLLLAGSVFSSQATEISVSIRDNEGNPLTNIVALLHSNKPQQQLPPPKIQAIMDQINREFIPHTLVVQKGSQVSFPNSDNVQHHVYSFSPAKTFELKLYSELAVEPLLFESSGVVELGCNVHDWMLGYIYVADTPYFAQSDNQGIASITVPAGEYTLSLWHPRLSNNDTTRNVNIRVNQEKIMVNLDLRESLLPSLVEYDAVEGFNNYD